jgi:hypothetical protein
MYMSSPLLYSHLPRSRTSTTRRGAWRILWWVREWSRSLSPSQLWLLDRCLCWGEGEDATLRSMPSLVSLHQRRKDDRQTPSLDAFASFAAPTETRRLVDSTLRPMRWGTKASGEVVPSRGVVQHKGPRAIWPIITGPAWPRSITGLICKDFSVITFCNPALMGIFRG